MGKYIEPIAKLVEAFMKLPNVGERTALKYAYKIIDMQETEVKNFAMVLQDAKDKIKICKMCGNFSTSDECGICSSRKGDVVIVVKDPKDVIAIERGNNYQGVYHVLHGLINPLKNITPNDINISTLLNRVATGNIKEVILATSTDVEGEATALYLAKLLKPYGVEISRIAHGIPLGSEIEYTDEITLTRAIMDRKSL